MVAVFRAREAAARGLAAIAGGAADGLLDAVPALVARAAESPQPVRALPAELADLRAQGVPSAGALAAPVASHGELLAVLVVAVETHDQPSLHPRLLVTVADLLAAALASALGAGVEGRERRLDPVTGLPNHRTFDDQLDAFLHSARTQKHPVALALLGVEGLARLIDERGGAVGDEALRELARAAASIESAAVFRIGGDEFALLFEAGAEEAVRACSEIAAAFDARTDRLVSVAAGVAAFPQDARAKDELVHRADLALHAAKRTGRMRPVTWSSDLSGAAARSGEEILRADLHGLMLRKPVRDAVVDELARLVEGMRALSRQTAPQPVLQQAAVQLRVLLGATACVVSRLDGDMLLDAAVVAPSPWKVDHTAGYLLDDYPLTREAIETGEARAASLADPEVDPSEAYVLRGYGMQANLMVPLLVGGQPWGLVEIFDARARTFGDGDVALAELVVRQIESLLARFEQVDTVQRLYHETLGSLSNALEAKDGYTSDHAQAVGTLAVAVARRVGLSGDALTAVEFGALLHDIGKIRVPESILNKPGPLDDEEWKVMRAHPEAGERILSPIASLAAVLPIVRSSHERWDGAGYPDRLAGEAIPLGARIVSVCDAYRAMIEPRPYRDAREPALARMVLMECSGSQFDPACVAALLEELDVREQGPDVVTPNRPHHLRLA